MVTPNGKAFVQGGISSTIVSHAQKPIESTKVQFSTSARLATNAMLAEFVFISVRNCPNILSVSIFSCIQTPL